MSDFVSFTEDELRLLICIADSEWGWNDEQRLFMKKLRKELFKELEDE